MDVEDDGVSLPYYHASMHGCCMLLAVQMDLLDAKHQIHFALLHSCSVDRCL